MELSNLRDLYIEELKDLCSAEKQLVKALPKMAKGAESENLRAAFEEHLEQTKTHVERLEQVFEVIDKSARAEHCQAMEGLIEEGAELLEEEGEGSVKDAALIAEAQKVEHYEIAGYGCARTLADLISEEKIVKLLQSTLDEEGKADKLLTQVAHELSLEPMGVVRTDAVVL